MKKVHEALLVVTQSSGTGDLEALQIRLCNLSVDPSSFSASRQSGPLVAAMTALCAGPAWIEQCLIRLHGGRGAALLQSLQTNDLEDLLKDDWKEAALGLSIPCHWSEEVIAGMACRMGHLQEASWYWWVTRQYNVRLYDSKLALRSLLKAIRATAGESESSAAALQFLHEMQEQVSKLLQAL